MHTLAMLRYHNTGCSDARCFAACPYAFAGVSSEWLWQVCATSAAVVGGAPGPVPQERGTGRGCLPPGTAGLEVTRPWALERQKRHQIRHFHFTIRASYLVTSVDKHQLSIFEETPGRWLLFRCTVRRICPSLMVPWQDRKTSLS